MKTWRSSLFQSSPSKYQVPCSVQAVVARCIRRQVLWPAWAQRGHVYATGGMAKVSAGSGRRKADKPFGVQLLVICALLATSQSGTSGKISGPLIYTANVQVRDNLSSLALVLDF